MPGGAGDFECTACRANGLENERNCDGKSNPGFRWTSIVGDRAMLQLNRCPLAWLATEGKEASNWCTDYGWVSRGFLPYEGGFLQQSAKWVAAIECVELERRKAKQLWGEGAQT